MRARSALVIQAHDTVSAVLGEGGLAIDATVGNGHDTLFLARQVGVSGRVFGFDVQAQALEAARQRLQEAGVADRVTLIGCGHEQMAQQLPPAAYGRVQAIMFNLGYLPGSDRACVTAPVTTLPALQQSLAWLAPGGVLTVLAYTAHAGGREEANAVREWGQALDPAQFSFASPHNEHAQGISPELVLIHKH